MALASLVDWRVDTWAAMLRHNSEIFGMFKCFMSPPALEDLPMSGWITGVWGMTGVYRSIIVAWKKSLQAVVLSDSSAHSDNDSGIVTPLVEPQVDSPLGPRHTKCPNAGKGGKASQLRKVGEAVIDAPARRAGKGQQFVIPDGEPENIMAPSSGKKRTHKKGQKNSSAPTLHIGENGEMFGLQKNPIPPGYISLQPLGSEHPSLGAGGALPDSASSILQPGSISEHEETENHSDKDMSKVCDELNMVDNNNFPLSNDEMRTSPPVEFSLDRHADENQDIDHTQHHQGQAEQWVSRPVHASQKDYRQNRCEDPGKRSQPQARSNAIAEVVHHIHQPNMDYDVVKRHQKTNCRARSASPMHLHSVRYSGFTVNQPKTKRACTSNLQSNNNHQVAGDSGDMKVDTDSEAAQSIQDGAIVAKRKTLGFFPDLWVKLLNYTKACFRLHLAIAGPFPTHKEALSDTGICLELITESIVAWEVQNHCLEADFYPQYEYDMATIYNDSINFCSRIKQIVINIVSVEYKLSGSESEIKQKAKALLKSSKFLRGERDKDVCTIMTSKPNTNFLAGLYF
ncbi:uncharacterized protein EDB91DRAFT_1084148 [Suillus paluster]|uniref:uncharacterized protein n=1 Tax=Suillus paluster TaxID=48578 RepID=UPI001B868F48|nr:uncharacterized protein EDB91DRAFT_1084148 [Suillus paluster]KAG1734245.1 hypothetical protein EDB91DRAFT_1084148 [Suillus paluster]